MKNALYELNELVSELEEDLNIVQRNAEYAKNRLDKIKIKVAVIKLLNDLEQKED